MRFSSLRSGRPRLKRSRWHCVVVRRRRFSAAERSGMVLMEVLISLVILGIAVGALMQSFVVSMTAIRKNNITTQACVLAESVLQAAEVDPPKQRKVTGNFEDQGLPKFSYTLETEEEELKYRNLRTSAKDAELKALERVRLTIHYEDHRKPFNPVQVETYLLPLERFTQRSKNENELFWEEEDRRSRF